MAITIGLGLAVARKFSARELMASPDLESERVSASDTGGVPITSPVEVEKGLAAADRGEFVEHEDIRKLSRYPNPTIYCPRP